MKQGNLIGHLHRMIEAHAEGASQLIIEDNGYDLITVKTETGDPDLIVGVMAVVTEWVAEYLVPDGLSFNMHVELEEDLYFTLQLTA